MVILLTPHREVFAASQLKSFSLWWDGPTWFKDSAECWPQNEGRLYTVLVATAVHGSSVILELINKYYSYAKLQRVVAFILRFIKTLKGGSIGLQYLSVEQLEEAEKIVIRTHQGAEVQNLLPELKRNISINKNSKISSLYPFIDKDGRTSSRGGRTLTCSIISSIR